MTEQRSRTASRKSSGGVRATTKTEAEGTALPVTNPLDLWYLCEKARYAKANPYRRARDQRPMYQRTVTRLIREDNGSFKYCFPYCGEVGFDMTTSPPAPLMSRDEKWRPSRFPLSYYRQIASKTLPGYGSVEVALDLLGKDELEAMIALPLPDDADKRGIWTDVQGGMRGLLRIPDVLRLHSFTNPGTAQYSQSNLACVIEMKFPGDRLKQDQKDAYEDIAGSRDNFRLLETSRCETSDKRLRRDWMRAAKKEPVYMPVGEAMSLPVRASAEPYALLVGLIDAEHDLARRQLEVKPPPPGTPMMSALPDPAEVEARQRQGIAQIEMVLAAPFVAVGAAMLTVPVAPLAGTAEVAEEVTITAKAGSNVIDFASRLRAVRAAAAEAEARAATVAARDAAAGGAVAAGTVQRAAAKPAEVPSATSSLSPEQQRQLDGYLVWNKKQQFESQTVRHYLFWPDAPGNTK